MITVSVTHDVNVLYNLKDDWENLQAKSANDSLYLTWDWAVTWWKHYTNKHQFWLIQARDDRKCLVGLAILEKVGHSPAPRFIPVVKWRQLQFSGAPMGREHLDFLAKTGHEREVIYAILSCIIEHRHQWDVLQLSGLCEGTGGLFIEYAHTPIDWQQDEPITAPFIVFPKTWDEYFEGLSKLKRKNTRRMLREIEERYPNNWSFERITKREDLDPTIAKMIELHQIMWEGRGEPGTFAEQEFINFFYDIMHHFFDAGYLRMFRLILDNQVVAVLCTYQYRDRIYDYVSGVDLKYRDLSIGNLVTYFSLKAAFDNGIREYDFLWGDESYKYDWNAIDRWHHSVTWNAGTFSRLQQRLVDEGRKLRQYMKKPKTNPESETNPVP
jgi:CelD/BcsL family acetyltransferase involved in cellulose biosynthesis